MVEPLPASCWSCAKAIDSPDHYCRHCGMGQGEHLGWYYQPAWLVILGLTAMGPFVLPLIWRSPRLSSRAKWIGTGLVAVFTYYVVKSCIQAIDVLKNMPLNL